MFYISDDILHTDIYIYTYIHTYVTFFFCNILDKREKKLMLIINNDKEADKNNIYNNNKNEILC